MMSLRSLALRGLFLILVLLVLFKQGIGIANEAAPVAARESDRMANGVAARMGVRIHSIRFPGPSIEPYVRPQMAARMESLRTTIIAAARRHNQPELSHMSDQEFAALIALILYNENFGWLEEEIVPLRAITPFYESLQREANERVPGSNFSIWPANLRPSVARELLEQKIPLPDGSFKSVPVFVYGSKIDPEAYATQDELFAAITEEISRDDMSVEYLAANLERGLYRASYEGAPISWRTLAAWHNQGIVDPELIRANSTASDYVRRASSYLPMARLLVSPRPIYPPLRTE